MATMFEIQDALRGLNIKELREQCRARGLNPAGGAEQLKGRLEENMRATHDTSLRSAPVGTALEEESHFSRNNYQRPGGNQNLGNRISERPSSRVLAPPGGNSQISFGDGSSYQSNSSAVAAAASGNPASRAAAEALLAKMGLGDTDDLVAGTPGPAATDARSFYSMAPPAAAPDARAFYNMPDSAPTPAAAAATPGKTHAYSQLAFGAYELPSTVSTKQPEAPLGKTPAEKMHDQMVLNVDAVIKPLMLKDLRIQCRARGLNPGGGVEDLRARLGEHMIATGDARLLSEGSAPVAAGVAPIPAAAYEPVGAPGDARAINNYARPGGQQNVGNFISDRPTSRVLAPPGGGSQIAFGDYSLPYQSPAKGQPFSPMPASVPVASPGPADPGYIAGHATSDVHGGRMSNNYSRPNGQQNVGNFLTDRPTSRVLAPPGGRSQITFG